MGSAERMKAVASLIQNDEPKIVVLSAMSGTTNGLVQIAETLYQNKHDEAKALIKALHDKYKQVAEELYTSGEKKNRPTSCSSSISTTSPPLPWTSSPYMRSARYWHRESC